MRDFVYKLFSMTKSETINLFKESNPEISECFNIELVKFDP